MTTVVTSPLNFRIACFTASGKEVPNPAAPVPTLDNDALGTISYDATANTGTFTPGTADATGNILPGVPGVTGEPFPVSTADTVPVVARVIPLDTPSVAKVIPT